MDIPNRLDSHPACLYFEQHPDLDFCPLSAASWQEWLCWLLASNHLCPVEEKTVRSKLMWPNYHLIDRESPEKSRYRRLVVKCFAAILHLRRFEKNCHKIVVTQWYSRQHQSCRLQRHWVWSWENASRGIVAEVGRLDPLWALLTPSACKSLAGAVLPCWFSVRQPSYCRSVCVDSCQPNRLWYIFCWNPTLLEDLLHQLSSTPEKYMHVVKVVQDWVKRVATILKGAASGNVGFLHCICHIGCAWQ